MKFKYVLVCIKLLWGLTVVSQDLSQTTPEINSILQKVDTIVGLDEKVKFLTVNTAILRYSSKTEKLLQKAQQIADNASHPSLLADINYSWGNFYYYNAQYDNSLSYLNKALNNNEIDDLPLLKSKIYNSLSGVYRKKGDIIQATTSILKSKEILESIDTIQLEIDKRIKYREESLILNNSIANFYNQLGDFEQASKYYELAYQMAIRQERPIHASVILSNKGDMVMKSGDAITAIEVLKNANAIMDDNNTPQRYKVNARLNLGMAYSDAGETEHSLKYLNEALQLSYTEKVVSGTMYALTARGFVFIKNKDYQQAIIDCEEAKNIAIETKDYEYEAQSCNCLYEAYKAIGNHKKALANHEAVLRARESLFSENDIKKRTEMEMQYEFDKQRQVAAIAQESKNRTFSIIIGSLILGFLSMLVIAGLMYRLSKLKNKANRELKVKNRQISDALSLNEALIKETHHRVKNSLQMISSLLYLQSENMSNPEAALSVKDGQMRVKSMALIHQKLYQKDNLTGIDISEYIHDLANDILQSHHIGEKKIDLQLSVDQMTLDVDTATPIGIILNELIVNALKHAFPNDKSENFLKISFKNMGDYLFLEVEDNGVGMENKYGKEQSFGLKLIESLARKLKAEVKYESNNGTKATVIIHQFKSY